MNKFHSTWRPLLGWVGLLTLFIQGVAVPLANLILGLPAGYMPGEALLAIVGSTLGVAGLRTVDKMKNTAKG